mgnify:CR=1 FL=1
MSDPYLYEDVPVLKNKLDIKNEKTLDRNRAFRIFLRMACGRFTGPCLTTFTNGPVSTASSISRSGRSCWQAEAFGTATKTGSRKISTRRLGG